MTTTRRPFLHPKAHLVFRAFEADKLNPVPGGCPTKCIVSSSHTPAYYYVSTTLCIELANHCVVGRDELLGDRTFL